MSWKWFVVGSLGLASCLAAALLALPPMSGKEVSDEVGARLKGGQYTCFPTQDDTTYWACGASCPSGGSNICAKWYGSKFGGTANPASAITPVYSSCYTCTAAGFCGSNYRPSPRGCG